MVGRSRAAQARMQRVLERAKAKQTIIEQAASPAPTASETVEIAAPAPVHLSPYDQARVDKWIRERLIDWPPNSCLHCRRPIVVGQLWTVVSNGEGAARFHKDCHAEWLEAQEADARRAMGLEAVNQSSAKEARTP